MILTKEVAERNIGRYIDCYKRYLRGYYPKQIIRLKNADGTLAVKDITGTCEKIEERGIYVQDYDYIFDMVEAGSKE